MVEKVCFLEFGFVGVEFSWVLMLYKLGMLLWKVVVGMFLWDVVVWDVLLGCC